MAQFFKMLRQNPPEPTPAHPVHPYSPPEIIVPEFVPNTRKDLELLLTFASTWVPILGVSLAIVTRYNPRVKNKDKIIILWFMLCGTLHTFFEGYFVFNHDRIGGNQDLLAELWKEYALSDSRYMTSDTFVLAAEGTTIVVLGGLSYLMVYLIATASPYRTPVQIMVCFGHIYSDTLYYVTSLLDFYVKGVNHCRPEPYYFWFYYVGLNFIWIIVPTTLLVQSLRNTSRAFAALDRMARSMQANEQVRKPNGKAVGN